MMNDTVREELQTKIAPAAKAARPARPIMDGFGPQEPTVAADKPASPDVLPDMPVEAPAMDVPEPAAEPQAPAPRLITKELDAQKTSPTLVEFQTKSATLPDWRLQLQNSVRQRSAGIRGNGGADESPQPGYQAQIATRGANALKADYAEEFHVSSHPDPRVANALKRISDSRKAFFVEDEPQKPADKVKTAGRNHPFNIVSRSARPNIPTSAPRDAAKFSAKPKLVSTWRIDKKEFDTNKLPPLPEVAPIAPETFEAPEPIRTETKDVVAYEERVPTVQAAIPEPEVVVEAEVANSEIEDLAPFSLRFNAGLFDLIIGGFASFIMLSPFVFLGGNWLSLAGVFAFAATCSIVMFIYLTTFLGLYGRTIGMRIFSLELVDADENEYPTFHQAAVSSAVYLLSLPLLGAGFLTVFFNEEKRAAHDLVSGTIIVTEL